MPVNTNEVLHVRNRFAFAVLTGFGGILVACCSATADWPRFLGSGIDGVVSDESTIERSEQTDWTGKPILVWGLQVGDGYGMGVVNDGRYYHFDAVADEPGRVSAYRRIPQSERLRCIDSDTGNVLWTQKQSLDYSDLYGYEAGPRASPTIDKDRIFTFGVRGRLTCRDLESGTEQWTVQTTDDFHVVQNFFGVASAPLVIDDAVIVMVGGSPLADQDVAPGRLDRLSPDGSGLVAFDRKNGKVLWKSVDDLASYSSPRPIDINGVKHVLCYARDHLWCVEAATGTVRWKYRHRADILESVNAMTPVVEGQRVFLSECYRLGSVLLDASGAVPKEIWKDPKSNLRTLAMRSHWATPVVHEGYLYGCSGRNAPDSDLRCIELTTGKVQWSSLSRLRSNATLVGDQLLVLEERGRLHIAEANPERWARIATHDLADPNAIAGNANSLRIRYPCWSAPIVNKDQILVRGDQLVLCLSFPKKDD